MWFYRFILNHMLNVLHFQIPFDTRIGGGLCLQHVGRVIFAPGVELGKNCDIFTGVTIGREFRGTRNGVPKIGNECWIGTNVVIVGKIIIGDNVLIAPNSFVNFDVPSNSIVIGNPGKIVSNFNATKGYIKYKV
jgi:serine O-acetyltransferase